jgi:two-component system sensor histidine kinase PilS (NtrC family)
MSSPAERAGDSVNRQRHRWLIQTTRLSLYVVVIALTVLSSLLQSDYINWSLLRSFYVFSLVGLLAQFLPMLSLESYFKRRALVAASFVLDIVLVSAMLASSGLNQSLFLFMYLVTIILAGLVFQTRGALLTAVVASLGFTISSWFGAEIKGMSFLFILVLNNIAFFAVAALAGYLSDQLNLFAERLEAQNLSLGVIRQLNELIVETMPAGLLTVNVDGVVLRANPGAQTIFARESLEGSSIKELLPAWGELDATLAMGRRPERKEVKLTRGGENILLSAQLLPQHSAVLGEETYLVVLEDLTQIRRLELAVQQSEKMAAIGSLAAGIAHEIRNPLAGISGSVELLSQQFSSTDDQKLTKIILREIDRLNLLISEFLDFAKPEKPPTDPVDLSHILREVIEQAKLSSNVAVDIRADLGTSAMVLGHGDKLKQAFLNIIINSLQAMSESAKKTLNVSTRLEKDGVIVTVKDTGCGMREETRKKMFEPFVTTKPKGTGLGLAITHKILEAHAAKIFVESEEGLGTEFVISFPRKSFDQRNQPVENKSLGETA